METPYAARITKQFRILAMRERTSALIVTAVFSGTSLLSCVETTSKDDG